MADHYMKLIVGMAVFSTAAAMFLSQKTPLETGHYKGNVDGNPAVLQVVYRGEEMRDCVLTVSYEDGTERSVDALCNDRGTTLFDTNRKDGKERTVEDLKERSKKAKGWVNAENKMGFDQVAEYLKH